MFSLFLALCDVGRYIKGSTCSPCEENTFQPSPFSDALECFSCPEGSTSGPESAECEGSFYFLEIL